VVPGSEAVDETHLTGVPYGVQRAVGRVFGPVGRALGYCVTYDRYLEESFWRSGSDDGGTERIDGIEREVELCPE